MDEARYKELEAAYHRLIPQAAKPAIAHGLYRGQAERNERQFRQENFAGDDASFFAFRAEYRRRHYPRRKREGWLKKLITKLTSSVALA